MDKFTTLTGVAAPLDAANVDTDQIIPKQFLLAVDPARASACISFTSAVS